VVERLRAPPPIDTEGARFKTHCAREFSITLSVHPAVSGYLTLFRAGEGEGSEEEG